MPIKHFPRSIFFICILACVLIAGAILATAHSSANTQQPKGESEEAVQQKRKATQERQERLRELDAKIQNPGMLLMRSAEFDPLQNTPTTLSIGTQQLDMTTRSAAQNKLAVAQESSYFIVQFPARILPEQTAALRANGYEIKAYVPNNAYIVKVASTKQAQLLANRTREFRWAGIYGAGLKIQPELVTLANTATQTIQTENDDAQNIHIKFQTFSGEKEDAIKAALDSLALKYPARIFTNSEAVISGYAEIRPTELPRLLVALANVEGIEWIQRYQKYKLMNDNGVKIIQGGGTTSNDTTLYRNGLTGTGQVVGVADAGADTDHASFRLSSDAAAQTLSFATTTRALVNGLLPSTITNPNNKILTYFVLGTGILLDNANNPNGGKVLEPTERVGSTYFNAVAYDDADGYHGTHTTSVIAGRDYAADGSGAVAGIPTRTSGDGMAPDARIVFQDVGHPSGQLNGLNVGQLLLHTQAYGASARIHSNSYGGSPAAQYDLDASEIDEIMWKLRDYTIFFSAGNDGTDTFTMDNDSKSALLVGAASSPTNSGNPENVANYSSHGPALDGRIKPDIVALGTVRSATESTGIPSTYGFATSTTALDAAVNPSSPNNNRSFSNISGTSFSAPMAAGGGALVRQYFTDGFYPTGAKVGANAFNPTNALIKAIILNSGRNMTGTYTATDAPNGEKAPLPNGGQGWGRMTLDDALYFAGDRRELKVIADIWNGATASDSTRPATNAAIQTGQTHTYQITNVSTVEPLRITLVWSDPKAAPSASVALINNLDLEVTDPTGKVFRGNVNFQNAFSQVANSSAFDNKNPLEAVYIQYPNPGTYTVKVIGANVPGNGQLGVIAQPGNQTIDSNRQGYALLATGNFTAGAVPVMALSTTAISGGVNADRFVGKNETVTATLNIENPTVVNAANVTVQVAVNAASQVPASLVRINGAVPGQVVSLNIGDIAGATSLTRGFQVTLVNDASIQPGQTITFNVTITPANGLATTTQFTITVAQRLITYRTRFEPTPDPGGQDIVVIPEADWSLRPDNPNPAANTEAFAGNWKVTTAFKSSNNGSTASLGDPSDVGASYGISTTSRSGSFFDDTRWWTKKIVLPGLNVDSTTGRVSNPSVAATLGAKVESFDVDLNADFTGDTNVPQLGGDAAVLRLRTYRNTVAIAQTDDTGQNLFTNFIEREASTNGFLHFGGSNFTTGTGAFGVDTTTADNSDVSFRLELQLRRNGNTQTGEGIFFDNVEVKLRINDPTVYAAPLNNVLVNVNGASFRAAETAPGELLSAFGAGFPNGVTSDQGVTSFPLPTTLNGVSVRVNGILAPLLYVGVGSRFGSNGAFQINYQLPFETAPGIAFVEVLYNGVAVTNEFLTVLANAPGLFSFTGDGAGQAAVLNQDYQPNGAARPEARGRVIQIYATGTGAALLDNATRLTALPATGTAPPGDGSKLYVTNFTPTVTIGGVAATVEFSGLAPGFVGLWQINARLPANAPTGNAVPLVIGANGRNSNQTTVAVN